MSRMSAATCVAALEQADLSVTATQLVGADSDHCRGALSIDKELLALRQETHLIRRDSLVVEVDGNLPLQIPEDDIYWRSSISRCALLNAPAGSFSKDIVEVEDYRVIVARHALARFGEER